MGISTSRLCDRRAYRGRIDGEYRMRAPSVASRSRTRGWRTATGPMPVMISRSGRWPWRTTRCWPVSVLRSVCFARNSATSASTAWVSSARAPLRRISVRESVKAPGWASLMTLLSDTAYHSFIGEVGALNTTTIRRLTRSRRHQLLAIAHPADGRFGKRDFIYQLETDTYRCPAGEQLIWRYTTVENGLTVLAVTGEELMIRLQVQARGGLGHAASHGLTKARPQPAKSPTSRVAISAPAARAVAAICASKASIGRPSRRRAATIS